jgi:hypothetical protein
LVNIVPLPSEATTSNPALELDRMEATARRHIDDRSHTVRAQQLFKSRSRPSFFFPVDQLIPTLDKIGRVLR